MCNEIMLSIPLWVLAAAKPWGFFADPLQDTIQLLLRTIGIPIDLSLCFLRMEAGLLRMSAAAIVLQAIT